MRFLTGLTTCVGWGKPTTDGSPLVHAHAEPHEANRSIAEIVAFPSAAGHAVATEQDGSDFPVCHALVPPVDGAQREEVASSL